MVGAGTGLTGCIGAGAVAGGAFAGGAFTSGVVFGEANGFMAGDAPGDGKALGVGVAAAAF